MDTAPPDRHLCIVEPGRTARATAISLFGPVGPMDEDGFSASYTYAEKAAIEQRHLKEVEQRIEQARTDGLYNLTVAGEAYCEDLRSRVENFKAAAAADPRGTSAATSAAMLRAA